MKDKKKGRSKSRGDKKLIRYYFCHDEGHIKKDCPDKRKKKMKKTQEENGEAAVVHQEDEGYEIADVLVVSTRRLDKHWIMDSGCSFHTILNHE